MMVARNATFLELARRFGNAELEGIGQRQRPRRF